MINFNFDQYCYGCTSCKTVCPVKAIVMIDNKDGFKIPYINASKCINCNLCDNICLTNKIKEKDKLVKEYYGGYFLNRQTINSASGGIFYGIALDFIKEGGYVVGAILDDDLVVKHILSNKILDLKKMQSSKYVQSDLKNIYSEVLIKLDKGIKILFCGTPCQVAGIKQLTNSENLYTISLICEGVPSPLVWEKRKKELERKYKSKLINVNFRQKINGKHANLISYYFENGKMIFLSTLYEDSYMMSFYKKMSLRKTCFECSYKGENINSDIIIGDFWGVPTNINDNLKEHSPSCIIVNTLKGQHLINNKDILLIKTTLNEICASNFPLIKSVQMPKRRDKFFRDIENKTLFLAFIKNYEGNKVKFIIKCMLFKIRGILNE